MSVWWAFGLALGDLAAFVFYLVVMVVAVRRVAKTVGPLLKMFQEPPQ